MIRTVFQDVRMTQSATDQIFEYWRSLTVDGRIPDRADINPSNIKSILPHVFILQLEEHSVSRPAVFGQLERDMVFRLAGSEICDLHTRELTKTSFKDLITPKDRQPVLAEMFRVFTHQEVKRLTTRVRSDYAIVDVETIVMPLSNGEEGVTRALGCLTPATEGRLWWKGDYPITSHELISSENIEWRPSNVIGDPRLQPPAHEVPVFELSRRAKRPEGRMVGHLTVIEGGARI